MTEPVVMDTETRDLINLVRQRQNNAIYSVVQLGRDPDQKYTIIQAAASSALASAAGAFDAWQGHTESTDPYLLAEAVLKLMREMR